MKAVQRLLAAIKPLPDGDKVARLSYFYTTVGLLLATGFVCGYSSYGQTIHCWFPPHFDGWMMEYAADYYYYQYTCIVPFVNKTSRSDMLFANSIQNVTKDDFERDRAEISNHQLVPFFLVLQALMFYVPILLWRVFYESMAFKLKDIFEACDRSGSMDPVIRKNNIKTVSRFLTEEQNVAMGMEGRYRHLNGGGISIVFAYLSLMFYVPVLLWRNFYESTGFKLKAICEACDISENMDPVYRKYNIKTVSRILTEEHKMAAAFSGKIRRLIGDEASIVFAYVLVKIIFAFNAIAQLWLLQAFIGTSSPTWGWDVAMDLFSGREWQETGSFPRVTLCDIPKLRFTDDHTVQCVLMINMFNEKILVCLWFWLVIMISVTLWSAISWITTSITTSDGRSQIKPYISKICANLEPSMLDEFITAKLRPDGR